MTGALDEHRIARQWRHVKKDGAIIYVEVDSHPLLYAGRKARMAVVTDVMERKLAEEALAHRALHDLSRGLQVRALPGAPHFEPERPPSAAT